MRKPTRVATAAVVLVSAVSVLVGCTVDGKPTRGPVDLDLGKYGSMQGQTLPDATTESAWAKLRAVRLADHMVFPVDVDPGLVSLKMPTMPMPVPKNLTLSMPDADTLPSMKDYQYGFSVSAGDKPNDFGINHMVMRFTDDRAAGAALTEWGGLTSKPKDWYKPGGGKVSVDGMPADAIVVHRVGSTDGSHKYMAVARSGSYLIYTWADSKDESWAKRAVVTAYQKQKALLDAIGPDDPSRNPDPTGLIRGTVKVGADDRDPTSETVWGQRGAALLYSNGPEAFGELQKAGITVAAINQTQAYRAGSAAQAEGWRKYLIKDFGDDTSRNAASPRDLSTATCVQKDDRAGCFVVVGSYVGEAYSTTLVDAQQQISAAYTFLKTL
ncbi:DUF7373 family lipoprotein [Gordonia spumicola]|nr:hypothetical protein [Gordonia spumicola]